MKTNPTQKNGFSERDNALSSPAKPKWERWGGILLLSSLFLFLTLLGEFYPLSEEHWLGEVGRWVGERLFWSLGAGSLLVPPLLLWWSIQLLRKREEWLTLRKGGALLFFLCAHSLSLDFLSQELSFDHLKLMEFLPSQSVELGALYIHSPPRYFFFLGGVPIHFLYRQLLPYNGAVLFGRWGTGLFSLLLLNCSSSLLFSHSPLILLHFLKRFYFWIKKNFLYFFSLLKKKRGEKLKREFSPVKKKERVEPLIKEAKPSSSLSYAYPPASLLRSPQKKNLGSLEKSMHAQAQVLKETLASFGIEIQLGKISCGPRVTLFEVHPSTGMKVQKITSLANDLALNLKASSIRIIAPIPGKAAVGIEVPNLIAQEVSFKSLLEEYRSSSQAETIPLLLGKNVYGERVILDASKMPHCIIAGATGSGKSVCINTLVISIIMNRMPSEVRLLMIDPKKVELSPYTKLPHMIAPVITEPEEACRAMQWLVGEMEKRYELFKELGVRNIHSFNHRKPGKSVQKEKKRGDEREKIPDSMPHLVCIIDELADLMMISGNEIEMPIVRIAQMARAVGIHLILATQRPSRDVITGLIKANVPTRIAFQVASQIDSRIVLDRVGAEHLLRNGDMLLLAPGSCDLERSQGAFISDEEIGQVVEFLCQRFPTQYWIQQFSASEQELSVDEKLCTEIRELLPRMTHLSTSFLAQKLRIREDSIEPVLDLLHREGAIQPMDGGKGWRVVREKIKSMQED